MNTESNACGPDSLRRLIQLVDTASWYVNYDLAKGDFYFFRDGTWNRLPENVETTRSLVGFLAVKLGISIEEALCVLELIVDQARTSFTACCVRDAEDRPALPHIPGYRRAGIERVGHWSARHQTSRAEIDAIFDEVELHCHGIGWEAVPLRVKRKWSQLVLLDEYRSIDGARQDLLAIQHEERKAGVWIEINELLRLRPTLPKDYPGVWLAAAFIEGIPVRVNDRNVAEIFLHPTLPVSQATGKPVDQAA